MAEEKVRLTVEWALWGKQPGDHDYRVLSCSQDGLTAQGFDQILNRFSIGTPDTLPQATIIWAGKGEEARIGIAIHKPSETPDAAGRRIAEIHYFCVRYHQLMTNPVSYLELYRRFRALRPPFQGQVTIEAEPMRPDLVAAEVDEKVMSTAALLLAGKPVCIVCEEGVSLIRRLSFLDHVSAMLPYGMRSRFSASTWTSSTAQHNIRLSFTEDRREDSSNVIWGELARIPYEEENARVYLGLLANHADRRALVAKLAQATKPMPFGRDTRPLGVLDKSYYDPREEVVPVKERDRAEDVITELAEALERDDATAAHECIQRLLYLSQGHTSRDRQIRIRQIIEDEALFFPHRRLGEDQSRALYGSLLRLAFGQTLSRDSLEAVIKTASHPLPPGLLAALLKMPSYDVVVRLSIAWRISPDELARALDGYQGSELVYAVTGQGVSTRLVEIVCNELARRQKSGEKYDSQLATELERNGFLADVLAHHYPASYQKQFELLLPLLKSAYGEAPLGVEELERALTSRYVMPTAALVSAVVYLYGPGAGDVLVGHFLKRMTDKIQLADSVREVILRNLAAAQHAPRQGSPALVPAAPQPNWQDRAQEGKGRRRRVDGQTLLFFVLPLLLLGMVGLFVLLGGLG